MGRELRRGDYELGSSPSMDRAVIVVLGTVAVDVWGRSAFRADIRL